LRKRFGTALYKTLQNPEIEIACLLTSVNEQYQRISMHGVRVELLQQQAESIGLPLEIMQIQRCPRWKSMKIMRETLAKQKKTR
jgi:diphthamide synthase (EF-2-diphthine--ammonia ligase)